MKRHPFLYASLTVAGIFLLFVLLILVIGSRLSGSSFLPAGDGIGVLQVDGPIASTQPWLKQIDSFRQQDNIKAVVLRIDSPGGAVGPSQELFVELKRLAAEKPLIVSLASVAASGGYYLAIAGDKIYTNPGTMTGSIGVIMSLPNYVGLMDKVGVRTETVKSGRFKDSGSSTREMTADDRELLQALIDDVYQQFVAAVSEQRGLSQEQLAPYVDGRVLSGRQAVAIGLVDELGGFNDAVAFAAQQSGLEADPTLIYPEPEDEDWLERLLPQSLLKNLDGQLDRATLIGPLYLW